MVKYDVNIVEFKFKLLDNIGGDEYEQNIIYRI